MIKALIAVAALSIVASPAAAVTITFDDAPGGSISNGYQGFNWNNFYTLTGTSYVNSGYKNGTVSPNNVGYNAFAAAAKISSSTAFSLTSAYLTGAWNDGLNVTLTGTLLGSAVYAETFVVNTAGPTFETFNHALVDSVVFTSGGGTHHTGFNGSGAHFAIDNLTVNGTGAVPEPASWALMIGGFGLVGGAMRRRANNVTFA